MAAYDETPLNDPDGMRVFAMVEEFVRGVITDLVDNIRLWPHKLNGGGMRLERIVEAWVEFARSIPSYLDELSRTRGSLESEIGLLLERHAGLDRTKHDEHAIAFQPLGQLAPLLILAHRASVDVAIRLHSAQFLLVAKRRHEVRGNVPYIFVTPKFGGLANALVLVVNGAIQSHDDEWRPFAAPVDARPLSRIGNESDDAMIARLARDILKDFNEVIERLEAGDHGPAAATLNALPFVMVHQDYGAPLARGPRPPVDRHFVPGLSFALNYTLIEAGRPVAAMIQARRGMASRNKALGSLRYARTGGRPLEDLAIADEVEALAKLGSKSAAFARRLKRRLCGRVVPGRPAHAPAAIELEPIYLLPERSMGGRPIRGFGIAMIGEHNECQAWLVMLPKARKVDVRRDLAAAVAAKRLRDRQVRGVLVELQRQMNSNDMMRRARCIERWRERAAALLILNASGGAHLRAGVEAAMEVANLVYIFTALDERD